jgi:tetratricopeptide (TPR) repeat protein
MWHAAQKYVNCLKKNAAYPYVRVAQIVVTVCVIAVLTLTYHDGSLVERVHLFFVPSVERAMEYGDAHFSSQRPNAYSISDAEYFYHAAEQIRDTAPFVMYQLARVYFLKGEFAKAHYYIDRDIAQPGGPSAASAFYIQGLIEGYQGDYTAAAESYRVYLRENPKNWAAINDYAWVLLKAEKFQDALSATVQGLNYFPENPWLLNTNAIALHEIGAHEAAADQAKKALVSVSNVSSEEWLRAYPGNDPRSAQDGLRTLKLSIERNAHRAQDDLRKGGL